MKQFEIEYCEKWNYHPEFDRVSKLIKMNFSNVSVNGNIKPPRSGAFEIILNNKLIFSKFEMNRFPTEKEIGNW